MFVVAGFLLFLGDSNMKPMLSIYPFKAMRGLQIYQSQSFRGIRFSRPSVSFKTYDVFIDINPRHPSFLPNDHGTPLPPVVGVYYEEGGIKHNKY